MDSCDDSRKSSSSVLDSSRSSLFGRGRDRSPLMSRHHASVSEQSQGQGRPYSAGSKLKHLFASDNSVAGGPDVQVTFDDSLNSNDSYVMSMLSTTGLNVSESTSLYDEIDGRATAAVGTVDVQRTNAARERLQNKIHHTLGLIQLEQGLKEDNVNEYLRLSGSGAASDKQQTQRIKSAFERKNQKSTQTIERLQRKLEDYQRRLKNVDTFGVSTHKQAKDLLKDVGQGLKDLFVRDPVRSREASPSSHGHRESTAATATATATAPSAESSRGFSGSLPAKIKETPTPTVKHQQYGSADNITNPKARDSSHVLDDRSDKHSHRGNSLLTGARGPSEEDDSSAISDSVASNELRPSSPHAAESKGPGSAGQAASIGRVASGSSGILQTVEQGSLLDMIAEMQTQRDQYKKLRDNINNLKSELDSGNMFFRQALDEERERYERLEEQLNDLSELHQNEVNNIKLELQSMQEKMEYQLEEKTRDMQDLLDSCQTKIGKMELQQQQQQLISVEGIENSNFRAILTKLINVMLALLAVVLVTVTTVASLLAPFLTSRLRIITTSLAVAVVVIAWQNWPVVSELLQRLFNSLSKT